MGGPNDAVEADVLDLCKDFSLVDNKGKPLPGFHKRSREHRYLQPIRKVVNLALSMCGWCVGGCSVLCFSAFRTANRACCGRARSRFEFGRSRSEQWIT